tara:strand:+ start:293 stop:463 length:171 start_codon:yes stop_codon:yes gene_type:complete
MGVIMVNNDDLDDIINDIESREEANVKFEHQLTDEDMEFFRVQTDDYDEESIGYKQ